MATIQRIRSITEFHRSRGLPEAGHPLISVVNYADVTYQEEFHGVRWMFDFYLISLKRNVAGKLRYGQQVYDFDEGVIFFIAPGQVFSIERDAGSSLPRSGWMLLIHPDFFWNTTLAKEIRKYEYFGYAINEALFVSKKEEDILMGIIDNIRQEYLSNVDRFSQGIIVSHIAALLNYSERFYNRQFITRRKANHQILDAMEDLLNAYFSEDNLSRNGLPGVQYLADNLNVSAKYLSSLLKVLTGQTAQQHIHEKLVEKAKEKLSTSSLSVSEIAYDLGFEHPQSFSKLFRLKTRLSPLEFRQLFNGN